jgi:hypothetical protein
MDGLNGPQEKNERRAQGSRKPGTNRLSLSYCVWGGEGQTAGRLRLRTKCHVSQSLCRACRSFSPLDPGMHNVRIAGHPLGATFYMRKRPTRRLYRY